MPAPRARERAPAAPLLRSTLFWDFQRYKVRMLQCYHCAFQCLYHRKHNIIKVAVINEPIKVLPMCVA